MEPGEAHIILRSSNGNYWKLDVSNTGELAALPVPVLPTTSIIQVQGDVFIQKDIKGVVLYADNGDCFLLNVSKRGRLLIIPANCP
jgi:hypothetical protein